MNIRISWAFLILILEPAQISIFMESCCVKQTYSLMMVFFFCFGALPKCRTCFPSTQKTCLLFHMESFSLFCAFSAVEHFDKSMICLSGSCSVSNLHCERWVLIQLTVNSYSLSVLFAISWYFVLDLSSILSFQDNAIQV